MGHLAMAPKRSREGSEIPAGADGENQSGSLPAAEAATLGSHLARYMLFTYQAGKPLTRAKIEDSVLADYKGRRAWSQVLEVARQILASTFQFDIASIDDQQKMWMPIYSGSN